MNCNVEESILIYALRYVLGRQSYAVSDVMDSIKDNWKILGDNSKKIILKDITNYLKEPYCPMFNEWDNFLEYLKKLENDYQNEWRF